LDTPLPQLTLQKIGARVAFKRKELIFSFKPIIHIQFSAKIELLTNLSNQKPPAGG